MRTNHRIRRGAVAMAVVMAFATSCGGTSTAVIDTIAADEAAALLTGEPAPVLLDIRTPEEFGAGHLEGAVNLDYYAADFSDRVAELDRDAAYVIYCRSGNRTASALEIFRDLGFGEVHAVDGGIVAWESTGYPVVRG